MGKENSTVTRVVPVFDHLLNRDSSGEWLAELLSLPSLDLPEWVRPSIPNVGVLESSNWGDNERGIPAPTSLLKWLTLNGEPQNKDCWNTSLETVENRRAMLIRKEENRISEALQAIDARKGSEVGWHILEGATWPDMFLQTAELIVVIEGKRTEKKPTIGTDWMPVRHQMLRHMDGALEIAGTRQVIGFFIVEGSDSQTGIRVPDIWVKAARNTISEYALTMSLPHRSREQRQLIADGFLGVTTWQQVCSTFNIPFPTDEVQP